MAETSVKSPTGEIVRVQHPEGATDDEIINYAKQNAPKPDVSVGGDILRSVAAAPRKVVEGLAGLPGAAQSGVHAGMDWLTGTQTPGIENTPGVPNLLPTPQAIQAQTSKALGPSYQPQTTPGKFAGAATEGVTGAMMGPGGLMAKVLMGTGSGLGSEAAGEQFHGSPYEPVARLAGGVAGGMGTIAAGKGVEAARNYSAAKSTGAEIGNILGTDPIKAGAVRRVGQSAADDGLTVQGARDAQAALGHDEAMVMDLGRQLQGRAEQMSVQPGKAQNTVLDAVEGRTGEFGSEASRRAKDTLDTHLGPSQDVVALKDRIHGIVQQHATPAYEKVMGAYPVVQVPDTITNRPVIAHAMKNAETLARNYGEQISAPGVTAVPSLKYWDYVKKDLDRRINGMMRTGVDDISSAEKADLGGLLNAKKALVQHLDTVTNGEYAAARKIASTKPELDEAMDFGRSIFSSKLLPEEVSAHIADLSLPAQAMAQIGARREIERAIGQVRNEGAKARAFLDTNNNLQKIESLFGPDAARAIEARVAAENTFQSATETIARNSRTAVRTELAKDTATPNFGDYHTTATGIVTAPIKSGLAYALEHGMTNTRSGISDILTAKQGKLPAVVEQLLKFNEKKASNATTPVGVQSKALLRALLSEQASQR